MQISQQKSSCLKQGLPIEEEPLLRAFPLWGCAPSDSVFDSCLPSLDRSGFCWRVKHRTHCHYLPRTAALAWQAKVFQVFFTVLGNLPWAFSSHYSHKMLLNRKRARCWCLMAIIPATQEAEIRRIVVQRQPGQIVWEVLSWKAPSQKGLVEWLKVKALSLSPSTAEKQKNF
jgi:hypothetical protein